MRVRDISPGSVFPTEEGSVEVLRFEGDNAILSINGGREYHRPVDGLALHIEDLQHRPSPTRTGDITIDSVTEGLGQFLGRGNDGMVFRYGPEVVKAATVTPYVPDNPGQRTVQEAIDHGRAEWEAHNALQGIPFVLPRGLYRGVGSKDRYFLVKPAMKVLKPGELTEAEAKAVRSAVEDINERGWALRDEIQLMRDGAGRLWFMDLGQAAPVESAADVDRDAVRDLFRLHGHATRPVGAELERKARVARQLLDLALASGDATKAARAFRRWEPLAGDLATDQLTDDTPEGVDRWAAMWDEIEELRGRVQGIGGEV